MKIDYFSTKNNSFASIFHEIILSNIIAAKGFSKRIKKLIMIY